MFLELPLRIETLVLRLPIYPLLSPFQNCPYQLHLVPKSSRLIQVLIMYQLYIVPLLSVLRSQQYQLPHIPSFQFSSRCVMIRTHHFQNCWFSFWFCGLFTFWTTFLFWNHSFNHKIHYKSINFNLLTHILIIQSL